MSKDSCFPTEEGSGPRETPKWKTHEGQRTEAVHRGGTTRSSDEVPETGWSQGVVLWCVSRAPTRRRSTMQMGRTCNWDEFMRDIRQWEHKPHCASTVPQWEPYEWRRSRTVLRERGGEIPRATHPRRRACSAPSGLDFTSR